MRGARFNPMRPGPSITDYFEKAFAVTVYLSTFACFSVIGLCRLSENNPLKKSGPPHKWKEENQPAMENADWDWEQAKLEFLHILNGVKIGGKYVFVPKPGTPNLEDYMKEKEARLRAERSEESRAN